MISTVFRIAVLRLWNNKQELLLTFVVPMLFFSIFALIFGRGVQTESKAIPMAVIDDDRSPLSDHLITLLKAQEAVTCFEPILETSERWSVDALTQVVMRERDVNVVIHLPQGLAEAVKSKHAAGIHLLCEGSNPIARQISETMLNQVVATAMAVDSASRQTSALEATWDPLQPTRLPPLGDHLLAPEAQQDGMPILRNRDTHAASVKIEISETFADKKENPKIAMYAAGIAVMFLLFSATGAGGSLLEEHEAGTLDRLLSSRLTLTQLLAGKWLYITVLGCVQLTLMFAWAQVAFHVDLTGHLAGFAVMTLVTAMATGSLALCMAVFCRSRTQLNAVSVVLILSMSALGGSMVPRYIMSDEMKAWGQYTFNAWAIDGFTKVFWHDLPVQSLRSEVSVLLTMTVILACLARLFADRWAAD